MYHLLVGWICWCLVAVATPCVTVSATAPASDRDLILGELESLWYEVRLWEGTSSSPPSPSIRDLLQTEYNVSMPGAYLAVVDEIIDRLERDGRSKRDRRWRLDDVPTDRQPFVYIHQRKTGGTSMRQIIHQSARQAQVPAESIWIPCNTGNCDDYIPPLRAGVAVYGAHMPWGSTSWAVNRRSGSRLTDAQDEIDRGRRDVKCASMFRNPIERWGSCQIFRFGGDQLRRRLPDDDPEGDRTAAGAQRLKAFRRALYRPDMFGGGCNNEIVRVFSSLYNENDINRLDQMPSESSSPGRELERAGVVSLTARHIAQCGVVTLLQYPHLNRLILAHYHPWIRYSPSVRLNASRHRPSASSPSNRSRSIFRDPVADHAEYQALGDRRLMAEMAQANLAEYALYRQALLMVARFLLPSVIDHLDDRQLAADMRSTFDNQRTPDK